MRKSCYVCGAEATIEECIPPVSLFPEKDEFQIDFKKDVIVVPSCAQHSLADGIRDVIFRNTVTSVVWNNVFTIFKGSQTLSGEEQRFDFSKSNCNIDTRNVVDCISLIALGLYFHEFKVRFRGLVTYVVIGFLESQFDAFTILKMGFNSTLREYPKKGTNPQVFFYQIAPAKEMFSRSQPADFYTGKGLLFRIAFYEGAEFFLVLEPLP